MRSRPDFFSRTRSALRRMPRCSDTAERLISNSSAIAPAVRSRSSSRAITCRLTGCARAEKTGSVDMPELCRNSPTCQQFPTYSDRRSALLLRRIQLHCGADECLQRLLVDLVAFVDVDGAAHVALEAGVEQAGRV